MSDELSQALDNLVSPGPSGSDVKSTAPAESWRPHMDVDMRSGGYVVSTPRPAGNPPSSEDILTEFGLEPQEWQVTGVRRSRWQRFDGEWLEAYRVSVTPAAGQVTPDFDIEKLASEIAKWRPSKGTKRMSGEGAYAVFPSDQQLGKKVGNDGTAQSVQRILDVTEGAVHRYAELRKIGRPMGTIVLGLLGDHVEGNVSQGGRLQSPSASDLGQTEQVRVARRLLVKQIQAFAPLTERLIVAVINGNHDEVTRQVAADPRDGWNVEIAAQVQDILEDRDEFVHVEFRYPEREHQTLTLDVCGTMLGLFHGHQCGRDVVKYLSNQSAGRTALGNADLWVSGHYHHFRALDVGPRLWVQAPTTDPGSAWFRDRQGMESQPGLLTMTLGADMDPRRDISVVGVNR